MSPYLTHGSHIKGKIEPICLRNTGRELGVFRSDLPLGENSANLRSLSNIVGAMDWNGDGNDTTFTTKVKRNIYRRVLMILDYLNTLRIYYITPSPIDSQMDRGETNFWLFHCVPKIIIVFRLRQYQH